MKVIIAGSRGCNDSSSIHKAIEASGFEVTEVVCGMARGVDMSGWHWAKRRRIPIKEMPADWDRHGKRAGFLRNTEMAQYADALIAVWDGASPGTRQMIKEAQTYGLKIYIYRL